ncbi:MAG: hypothetical protein ACYTEL_04825 [Planctomycetota bacterium]|jgi:hypothetical protein
MLATVLRLTQREEEQVIRLMGSTNCPSHFNCLSKQPYELCRVEPTESDIFVKCLDPNGNSCCQSPSKGAVELLCKCPMRVYLNRHFGI